MTKQKFFLPIYLLILLSINGCAVNGPQKGDCQYTERDLTVAFEQRTYWCIPNSK